MPDLEMLFPLGIAHYLIGGLAIGVAVSFLFLTTGLIGGMSTVFTSSWSYVSTLSFFQQDRFLHSRNWRLVYAAGLIIGAGIWFAANGFQPVVTEIAWWQLALGGFVAGYGARMSNGCTSGHGICGLGSLQLPSLLAVIIFLASAMASAALVEYAGGLL